MKFFKKRSVAVVVLVLAILASCAYGLYKKPADQLNVQYGTWLLDGAGVLSADTEQTIGDYNQKWDSSYRAVIAVASTDDIHGWTAEKYAKTLGKSWGLGANDMLLLIVKGGDYYVALGDALNQSLTDTQIAKLQSAIETPYYQGDCDGAATAFFRQADVVLAQVMQSGGSSYSGGYSESYNGGWVDSSGASVSSVIVLIIAIFVIWVLLDRMRYTRYQRRIRVGGRKGKLRLQGGLNVRQPDLCIRAQFRQPFHHAVELQIVLRPRILAQQRKRIRVDAAPLPAGVYRMAVQIQAERGFHLRGLGVQGGKAEGKARQAVDEFHCRSADAPVTGFHTRKNQLVVLRGLSLQQKGQKLAPLRIVQRVQVLEIQRVFRIAKRRTVVSQQIIPGFTAQQVTVDLNKRVAATRAAQVDRARQIFLPCSGGAEQKYRCASCRRLQDALMILGGEAGDVIDTGGARLLQLAAVIVADAVFVPGNRGGGSEKIKGGIGLSVGGKLHRFNVVQQPAELLHDLDASRGGHALDFFAQHVQQLCGGVLQRGKNQLARTGEYYGLAGAFVQELAQELVFAAQLAVGAAEKNSLVERGADAFGAGGDKESVDIHLLGGGVGDHIAQDRGIFLPPQVLQRGNGLAGGLYGKYVQLVWQQRPQDAHILCDVGISHNGYSPLVNVGALKRTQDIVHGGADLDDRQRNGLFQQSGRAAPGDDHIKICVEAFLRELQPFGQIAHADGQLQAVVFFRGLC